MIKIESSRQTWTADPQKSKSRKQSDGKTFTFDTKSILFVRYLRSCKSQKTMPELCKCRHCQHYPSTSKAILNSSFIFECTLTSELTLSHCKTSNNGGACWETPPWPENSQHQLEVSDRSWYWPACSWGSTHSLTPGPKLGLRESRSG